MSEQNKLEEILRKYASINRGTFGEDKTYGDYDVPEAVKAIHKEFADELQRIGEEIESTKEKGLPIDDSYRIAAQINEYYAERDGHDRAIDEIRTRLSQIVKEYVGGDE